MHADILQGTHSFGEGDLVFVPLVHPWKDRIPFHDLLTTLNSIHKMAKPE